MIILRFFGWMFLFALIAAIFCLGKTFWEEWDKEPNIERAGENFERRVERYIDSWEQYFEGKKQDYSR